MTTQNMPAPMSNVQIADTYLEAYRARDLSRAMLAPQVTVQYPLTPIKIVGRDNVLDYMAALLVGVDEVRIERHLTEGEYVATVWEGHTAWGVIPVCSLFRICGGLITEVRSFFDPRPIVQRP